MWKKPPTALPAKPAPPVTPKKLREERRRTASLVRRLSEDSTNSPMGPDYVTIEITTDDGEETQRRVYVTEVNGTRTLDLYSGWNPETNKQKYPMRTLPSKLCVLSNLQRLWVSHNHLSSLPGDLERLVSLKELFLHANKFEEFPFSICSLRSLEILWLSNNKIASIPDEISQLRTLKRLHLDGNQITELTSSLCTLTGLEVLYLNQNMVSTISKDVGSLTSLRRFYLQENKIVEVPNTICNLKIIKILNLDDNEICHFPSDFKAFKLERESNNAKIYVENNPFFYSTPQHSRSKLSLTNLHQISLKSRRHSDQYEQDMISRRPIRVSLPGTRMSDSLPAELHMHGHYHQSRSSFGSERDFKSDFKSDTLPRSGSAKSRRSTYHEH